MKRIIKLVVCLMLVGMQGAKAQTNIIALHHEGNVTICTQGVQDAINQAMDGDTLYLSEGMFGGFSIDRGLTIIGSGMTTTISSDVTTTGEFSGLYISNMQMMHNLTFNGVQDSIRLVQCRVEGGCSFNWQGENSFTDAEFQICHFVGYLKPGSSSTKGLSVINSKIMNVKQSGAYDGAATFVNCQIKELSDQGYYSNNFVNCVIIGSLNHGNYKNCLYQSWGNESGEPTATDCWQNDSLDFRDDFDCIFTEEQLREAGYLGTDGSVVGVNGGAAPFTLVSPLLQVTEHKLEVDNANRKMTVTLKLGNK